MKRALPVLLACFPLGAARAQSPITIAFSVQHANCGNATGSILASVWGGAPPYVLLWSPSPPSGQGLNLIEDVPPGTYTLTVTDAQGATASEEATVVATPDLFPPIDGAMGWACEAGCTGLFYSWIPMSGSGMPYTISFAPPGPSGSATPNGLNFYGLCTGEVYDVVVTNNDGCSGYINGLAVEGPANPVLLDQSVVPSCPGGATGGFTLYFSDADSIIVSGPNGAVWMPTSNPFTATNLAPGTYSVFVSAGSGGSNPPSGTWGPYCDATFTIDVPETTEPCGTVSGVAYADLDGDCAQGAGEPGLPYRVLEAQPGGHYLMTGPDGTFGTALLHGDYALDASMAGYAPICPDLPAPFTLSDADPSAVIDIAMEPLFGPDAALVLNAGQHRPGFPVTYTVTVINNGPFNMTDLTVELDHDAILEFT
ncbi:MAG: hypothetical protein ACK4L7_00035, partial [Flavobacteriales bacterium]